MAPKRKAKKQTVAKDAELAATTETPAAAAAASSPKNTKKAKVTSADDPLKLAELFDGAPETWLNVIKPVLEAQPGAADIIGPNRPDTIVPVRQLTFQALKPRAPEEWNVVVFGQNPYPRQESATGIAMFDNTFSSWEDKRFGRVTSMRCIIKAAAMWSDRVRKDTTCAELRVLLKKKKTVQPPEWFGAMLSQGCLLLNAALTTAEGANHTTFWRPVCRAIVEEIFRAKQAATGSKQGIVFAWWGTKAKALQKIVSEFEDKYPDVSVEHLMWSNPAAMADAFCNEASTGGHFTHINEALGRLSLPEINWLPSVGWEQHHTAGATTEDKERHERMSNFVQETAELHKMYLERLQGGLEKTEPLKPVNGIMDAPTLPIEEVGKQLAKTLPRADIWAQSARAFASQCKKKHAALTADEIAAIHLYTMGCGFYRKLNEACRNTDRQQLKPFFPYLKLLFTALDKLNADIKQLWRGVALDLKGDYPQGERVVWWGVSSCTSNESVARGFLGSTGKRTLFEVVPRTAVPIMPFSAFQAEAEYVLAPGTQLQVTKVTTSKGLTTVRLAEVEKTERLMK